MFDEAHSYGHLFVSIFWNDRVTAIPPSKLSELSSDETPLDFFCLLPQTLACMLARLENSGFAVQLNWRVIAFTLTSTLLSGQAAYQVSRPLRLLPPGLSRSKTEQALVNPRPRFRGWKHTTNAEKFRSCGGFCRPTQPTSVSNLPRPLTQLDSSTLSSFDLRPHCPPEASPPVLPLATSTRTAIWTGSSRTVLTTPFGCIWGAVTALQICPLSFR